MCQPRPGKPIIAAARQSRHCHRNRYLSDLLHPRDHALSDEFVRRLSLRDTDTVVRESDLTLATAG
jgi:hypothetical protein